jgi:hypothetical protein
MKNAPTRIAAAGPVPALKFGNILVSPPEGVFVLKRYLTLNKLFR